MAILNAMANAPKGIVILEDSPLPSWKKKWDEAREHASRKEYPAAAQKYSELLQIKPQVEEIRWEYCKVLVEIQDWLTAAELIENLLETDGNRQDYLLLAGQIALENKEFKKAVDRFGKVYTADPAGPNSVAALKGLVTGLNGMGRKREAFPLMELLYRRTPKDKALLQDLAGIAQDLEYLEKARDYYSDLVDRFSTDDETMVRASSAFEESGAQQDALAIWERYLERQPGYLPFHKKIADYYMLIGKPRSALPHILYMIENGVEDDELVLVAGRILLNDEKRPEKALQYLEQYAEKHPEDINTGFQIEKIRTVLADDFISIVEKDGVQMLWDDLVKITPNREAIYIAMADELERKGNLKDMLKILLVIHQYHPEDHENIYRIARTYFKIGNYTASLTFQDKIDKEYADNREFLMLRAETAERVGMDVEALRHYSAVLEKQPENDPIRAKALYLAGRLGLVGELRKLYGDRGRQDGGRDNLALSLDYLEGLRTNALFDQTWPAYDQLLQKHQGQNDAVKKILLHKADTLLASRQYFLAEQVLRELMAGDEAMESIALRLAVLAVQTKNSKSARDWFNVILQQPEMGNWKTCSEKTGQDIFRLHLDILLLEGLFEQVVVEIDEMRQRVSGLVRNRGLEVFLSKIDIVKCQALYGLGEYDLCQDIINRLLEKKENDVELAVLWFQVAKKKGKPATAFRELDKMLEHAELISPMRLFQTVEVEIEYGEYEAALHHINFIQQIVPDSIRALVLKAEVFSLVGKLEDSLQVYHNLMGIVGEQKFFSDKVLELELKRGNFAKVVKESEEDRQPSLEHRQDRSDKKPVPDYWRRLLLARALWTAGEWDTASEVYEHLLDDPVQQDFQSAMEAEKIEVFHPPLKKSIWNILSFSRPATSDPLAYYMEPEFVSRHTGKSIDRITARMYEKYRWQRLIRNEYQAKMAERRKDIREAERQYKQLVEKDASVGGLYDLAQIYGRLGEYGKEAQLYKDMRQYGFASPELSEAIKRNELLRKPRLSADFEVVEKKGRSGYIDTFRRSQGGSFWFMPALEREASLEYRRNAYSDSEDVDTIRGHRLVGSYSHDFPVYFDVQLRGGAENLDEYDTTAVVGTRINCQLDEHLKAYILFDQNPVYDTLAALEKGIYSQDYETGLIVETPKGIAFGGDYRRRRYSDDNSQDQTHLWSGYAIYAEATTFKFQYDYRTIDNSNESSEEFSDVTTPETIDTPLYWSPDKYWEHLATFSFQHLLKTYSLTKGTPSYYSLDYSVGFESGEILTHRMGFEILLEMSTHFLLKGNVSYATSDDYDQKGALLSVIYRW